jgi:energy-coupling factor transport system permease protein
MHPGAWLLWATGAGMVAISTTNPFYLIPLVAACWLVYAAHRRAGEAGRSFRLFLIVGLVTVMIRTALVLLGPVNRGSIALAAAEGFRLAVLLIVFGTYNSVSDPYGVLRLAPRRFYGPALAAALALSIAPRTIAATVRVRAAQRMRGIATRSLLSLPALAVPVLETSMEEAVTLAESMDARGHGRGPRTRYRVQRWGISEVVVGAAAMIAAAAFVTARFTGAVPLELPAFPLTWPPVSPLLATLTVALGVPAAVRSS